MFSYAAGYFAKRFSPQGKNLHIAIDALGIYYFGGGRTATLTMLESLFAIDHQNQYDVYLSTAETTLDKYKANVRQVIFPLKNRFLMRLYAQLVLPIRAKKYDLIHYMKNLGVFGLNIPTIVTMYDMTTLLHPEIFPKFDVWYWKTLEKITLQKASRVIAISETTANDLIKFYSLNPEQIKVIYPTIAPRFTPASEGDINLIRNKYHLPDSYILHVGRIDLKKSLTLLVEAFALARRKSDVCSGDRLVLVGDVYLKSRDEVLRPTIERLGLQDDVQFLGNVPDADLPAIISGAKIAVSASIHEGFGLAAVEALACGTPFISYCAGALEEVVSDAAYLLDTLDAERMAAAIIRVRTDTDLRNELIRKGLLRAELFKSEHNAIQTLQLYEEIINENKRETTADAK